MSNPVNATEQTLPMYRKLPIILAGALLVIAIGVAAYVLSHERLEKQMEFSAYTTVWALHVCVVGLLGGVTLVAKPLYERLGIKRLSIAVGIFVGGYAACGLAPQTNRIFFDEHIYMQIGQTMAHTGAAKMTNYGRAEYGQIEVYTHWINKQPNGLPYLLHWAYRIFGVNHTASFMVDRLCIGAAAAGIYLALALSPWAVPIGSGLAAAVLFIFTPLVLWWGHTVASEPPAVMAAILAVFGAFTYVSFAKEGKFNGWLLFAVTMAFACYFRPETALVFPVCGLVLLLAGKKVWWTVESVCAFVVGACLSVPQFLHIWSVRTDDWGADNGNRFPLKEMKHNLVSNLGYFVDSKWFPIAGTVLALIGLAWLIRKSGRLSLTICLWFLLSWGIFVTFYAGGYHYGASSRYALPSCAPVAVLMGIGFSAAFGYVRRWPAILVPAISVLVLNWGFAMRYVPTIAREACEARADVEFVEKNVHKVNQGALVLSCNPQIWLIEGKNAGQVFLLDPLLRNNANDIKQQFTGGIYLHYGYWNNVDKEMGKQAMALIDLLGAEVVAEEYVHDKRLVIYRFDPPKPEPKKVDIFRPQVLPPVDVKSLPIGMQYRPNAKKILIPNGILLPSATAEAPDSASIPSKPVRFERGPNGRPITGMMPNGDPVYLTTMQPSTLPPTTVPPPATVGITLPSHLQQTAKQVGTKPEDK